MYVAYTDASVRQKYGGIGYVIFKDNIPVDKFRKRTPRFNSVELEMLAIKELLIHIKTLGIKNIEINTDCLNVITFLKMYNKNKKVKSVLVSEIADYINSETSTTVKWTKRNKNKVADKLSKEASSGIKEDLHDSSLLKEYENQKRLKELYETKMVVRYRNTILMRCITCRESKTATEFPRYKVKGKNRSCKDCQGKMDQIHSY